MKYTIALHWAALLLAAASCTPEVATPPTGGEAPSASAAPSNRIDVPPGVRRNLGVTFAGVEARAVARTLRVAGAFELLPLARREYHMILPGQVELLVDQFDRVEEGTPLFRFRSPEWPELLHEVLLGEQAAEAARADIQVARARLEEAVQVLDSIRARVEALARADFKKADLEARVIELEASLPRLEAEIGKAETRLANALGTREHALHRASMASGLTHAELVEEVPSEAAGGGSRPRYQSVDWIEVRATQPGVVQALDVSHGAFAEATSKVLSTVDSGRVRFRAQALQSDLESLVGAQRAELVPAGDLQEVGAGQRVAASLKVGLEAHPMERTIAVIATPEAAADWMRPGISAFLEIVVEGSEAPALAVPRSAVVRDGLRHVVFRRDPKDPNTVIRIDADLGASDGQWVVLESGVMRGDEVVLSGAYELKLATQQSGTVQEGGHFHADGSFHGEH